MNVSAGGELWRECMMIVLMGLSNGKKDNEKMCKLKKRKKEKERWDLKMK